MTGGSIGHLPEPLQSFFQINVNTIRSMASQEPPGKHYIDIDYYPEFFAGTLPHDVNDLIDLYGYPIVEDNGMGPWTYANYVDTLTGLMSAAVTKQDWLNLLPVAAAQAHYIEDMHNPLHLTMNYDGQLTGNNGIHSRYETQMVNRNLSNLTFTTNPAVYLPTVIEDVFDGIDVHYYFVDDIMDADDLALGVAGTYNTTYYNALWGEMGDATKSFFEEGSQAVANGWYTAWVNAGSPIPNLGLAGDYNGNNVIDAADYAVWRDAMTAGVTTLVNDPTPGAVTEADFTYWRDHFGASIGFGAGAGAATAVPEPSAMALLALAALGSLFARRN
jgi:PEP-CTERM motif